MLDRGALYELGNRYRHVDIGKKKKQPHPLNRAQQRYGVMLNLNWVATEKGIMRLSVFYDKWIKWKTRNTGYDFLEDMPALYSPPRPTANIHPPTPVVETITNHAIGQYRWSGVGPSGECFYVWYKWFSQEGVWGIMANPRYASSAKYIQQLVNNGQIDSDMDNIVDADFAIKQADKWFTRIQ